MFYNAVLGTQGQIVNGFADFYKSVFVENPTNDISATSALPKTVVNQ